MRIFPHRLAQEDILDDVMKEMFPAPKPVLPKTVIDHDPSEYWYVHVDAKQDMAGIEENARDSGINLEFYDEAGNETRTYRVHASQIEKLPRRAGWPYLEVVKGSGEGWMMSKKTNILSWMEESKGKWKAV
jgi:hypothetical protein